jgi:hypothetical protein
LLQMEHRAFTIALHLFLSLAAFLASPHDIRIDLNSASSVHLLGPCCHWPASFLLPWGFHSSACLRPAQQSEHSRLFACTRL